MADQSVIGVGTLLHSAAFGLIAIAAPARCRGFVLVDARVGHSGALGSWLTGTVRNASGGESMPRLVELVLLDRRGKQLASQSRRLPALRSGESWTLRSRRLTANTARFRIQLLDDADCDARNAANGAVSTERPVSA